MLNWVFSLSRYLYLFYKPLQTQRRFYEFLLIYKHFNGKNLLSSLLLKQRL